MGTRGAMGFRINGQDKLTYNHFDSYPSGLGSDVLKFLKDIFDSNGYDVGLELLKDRANVLVLVNEDQKPTPDQVKRLKKFADTSVSSQKLDEWYVLLRQTQGDLNLTLKAGYMIDSRSFMLDGLFCEHAYVINLDDEVLEYYRGFFKRDDKGTGRYWEEFQNRPEEPVEPGGYRNDYGAVCLMARFPLKEINDVDAIVQTMDRKKRPMQGKSKTKVKQAA